MGSSCLEGSAKCFQEFLVRRIIRPKREDTSRVQVSRERAHPIGLIEARVLRSEQVARRMIDIQEHRVKLSSRSLRIEAVHRSGAFEEICLHDSAARITRDFVTERNQGVLMPFNYWRQELDD